RQCDRAARSTGAPDTQGPRARRAPRLRLRPRVQESLRVKRRIGIDVGGTNTDAVLLEDARVVHAVKTPTTADVTSGVAEALRRLLQSAAQPRTAPRAPSGDRFAIDAVMIGTTHFTNAVVQRRDLTRVGDGVGEVRGPDHHRVDGESVTG